MNGKKVNSRVAVGRERSSSSWSWPSWIGSCCSNMAATTTLLPDYVTTNQMCNSYQIFYKIQTICCSLRNFFSYNEHMHYVLVDKLRGKFKLLTPHEFMMPLRTIRPRPRFLHALSMGWDSNVNVDLLRNGSPQSPLLFLKSCHGCYGVLSLAAWRWHNDHRAED